MIKGECHGSTVVAEMGSGLAMPYIMRRMISMARPLRIEFPGALYHIASRGNAREDIFLDKADRVVFQEVMASVVKQMDWVCHGYCSMTNHSHLVIETLKGNLSRGMRQLNGVYTQKFNRRHERVGRLFQSRYESI